MIVRPEGTTLVLITQPEHARLAADIMARVNTEPGVLGARRATLLLATREHDTGWTPVDAAPTIDPETGRPTPFTSGTAAAKLEIWERGVTAAAKLDQRAGAFVAQHALAVHDYRRIDPAWRAFFATLTALRDALLRQLGAAEGPAREAFDHDYRVIRLGDAFSLHFCNGWTEQQHTLGYTTSLSGLLLRITPDPFGGARIPLRVLGHRIPARGYTDDADLRRTMASVTPEVIVGEATGQRGATPMSPVC